MNLQRLTWFLLVGVAGCSNPVVNSDGTDGDGSSSTETSQGPTTLPQTTIDDTTGETAEPSSSSSSGSSSSSSESGSESSSETGDTSGACEPDVPPMTECNQIAPPPRAWTLADEIGVQNFGIEAGMELKLPDLGGGTFIPQPDFPISIECSVWDQDCPDGEKCMPWANDGGNSWNATRCSPLDPDPQQVGDECVVEGSGVSGVDNCDIRAMCFFVDAETNQGECVEMCSCNEITPVCDTPNTFCSISNEGVLTLCREVCNPVAGSCPEGTGCYPAGDLFACFPDASGEGGELGDPCEFLNVCNDGSFCANAALVPNCQGSQGCCAAVCAIGDGSNCSDGTECVAWYDEGQAPDECLAELGACVIPE